MEGGDPRSYRAVERQLPPAGRVQSAKFITDGLRKTLSLPEGNATPATGELAKVTRLNLQGHRRHKPLQLKFLAFQVKLLHIHFQLRIFDLLKVLNLEYVQLHKKVL